MLPVLSEKPCCGPFAQKRRRLEQLDRLIAAFHSGRDGSDEPDGEQAASLERAEQEMDTIRNWMRSHTCQRPPQPRTVRTTRF